MKKLLALLLAVLTIVSVFSVSSFAENEPVEELPQIELNLSTITNEEYNQQTPYPYLFGMGETLQLVSNAPNTKYTVTGSKYAHVSETGLLSVDVELNPAKWNVAKQKDRYFELTAEAEGYSPKTYCIYIYNTYFSKMDIYFKNLKSQTHFVTNVGKNPKVILGYIEVSDPSTFGEYDISQNMTVKSSNTNIATVNLVRSFMSNNKFKPFKYLDIKCLKAGSTNITVTDGVGNSSTFKLYVQKNTTATQTIGVGEKYTPQYLDKNPSFNSGNNSVKFSGKYIVGNKPGTTTVSFLNNGVREHITFIVKKAPTKVSLNVTKRTIGLSDSLDLNSSVPKGCASRIRRYYSSNTKVAKVHLSNGMVTPVGNGTCKIVCKTYNGKKATCYVTVKGNPKKIIVSNPVIRAPYSLAYDVDYFYKENPKNKDKDYIQINAKTDNGTNGKFKYKSSDTRIVKVNNKGRIYVCDECLDYDGKTWTYGKNTAYITITAYNGIKTVVKVIVYNDAKECQNYADRGTKQQINYVVQKLKTYLPNIKEGKISKANYELRKHYVKSYDSETYGEMIWDGTYVNPYSWCWYENHRLRAIRNESYKTYKEWVEDTDFDMPMSVAEAKQLGYINYYAIIIEGNEYILVVW